MRPLDCPEFEYANHPQKAVILPERQQVLYRWIEDSNINTREAVTDSRVFHRHLFEDLCPPGCYYYAGHYRGERFKCLAEYEIEIQSDPRVGVPAREVAANLAYLALAIKAGMSALDEAFRVPKAHLSPAERVQYVVTFACRVFVELLTIHPYANGNGHIARFCLVAILRHYGFALKHWTIDPSPQPPYADLIYQHRRGQPAPLERAVLQQCRLI